MQQHNICRVKNKCLFLAKKEKFRNLHSTIQNKTLIQSEIYLQHHEQNAGRKRDTDQIQHLEKKQLSHTFTDRFFRQNNPLRIIISFTKTRTPCRPISKKSDKNPYIRIKSVTKSAGSTIFLSAYQI